MATHIADLVAMVVFLVQSEEKGIILVKSPISPVAMEATALTDLVAMEATVPPGLVVRVVFLVSPEEKADTQVDTQVSLEEKVDTQVDTQVSLEEKVVFPLATQTLVCQDLVEGVVIIQTNLAVKPVALDLLEEVAQHLGL